MAWVHSIFLEEEDLEWGEVLAHWYTIFDSAISNLPRKGREEGISPYTLKKTVLVQHIGRPENINCGRYRVLSNP